MKVKLETHVIQNRENLSILSLLFKKIGRVTRMPLTNVVSVVLCEESSTMVVRPPMFY